MNELGKLMVIAGVMLIIAGAICWSGFGRHWLGRLPGDINYTRGNFSVHFPLVTCILVSLILSLIFWIFRK
jgi:Protein of unknown function (DUF2905)